MASAASKKLDEKHSKILRQLLSLPENRNCCECPSKQLAYVNLFNSSFLCTRCSGLVREINHRVKSVSASSFTPEEIKALQDGGNEIWMAKHKQAEYSLATNVDDTERIKEAIRLKYVQKKWYDPSGHTATAAAPLQTSNSSASPNTFRLDETKFGQLATAPTSVPAISGAKRPSVTQQAGSNLLDFDLMSAPASAAPVAVQSNPQVLSKQSSNADFFGHSFNTAAVQMKPSSAIGTAFVQKQSSATDFFGGLSSAPVAFPAPGPVAASVSYKPVNSPSMDVTVFPSNAISVATSKPTNSAQASSDKYDVFRDISMDSAAPSVFSSSSQPASSGIFASSGPGSIFPPQMSGPQPQPSLFSAPTAYAPSNPYPASNASAPFNPFQTGPSVFQGMPQQAAPSAAYGHMNSFMAAPAAPSTTNPFQTPRAQTTQFASNPFSQMASTNYAPFGDYITAPNSTNPFANDMQQTAAPTKPDAFAGIYQGPATTSFPF